MRTPAHTGTGLGWAPLARAARWDDRAGADEAFELGGIGIERAELGDRAAADGDDGALTGLGGPHRFGEACSEFPDADRSALRYVHMCTQAELHGSDASPPSSRP